MTEHANLIQLINYLFNAPIFMVAAWASLDPRVRIKFSGSVFWGVLMVGAAANMQVPTLFGLLPISVAQFINFSISAACVWFRIKWKDERQVDRTIFLDRRDEG